MCWLAVPAARRRAPLRQKMSSFLVAQWCQLSDLNQPWDQSVAREHGCLGVIIIIQYPWGAPFLFEPNIRLKDPLHVGLSPLYCLVIMRIGQIQSKAFSREHLKYMSVMRHGLNDCQISIIHACNCCENSVIDKGSPRTCVTYLLHKKSPVWVMILREMRPCVFLIYQKGCYICAQGW